MTLMIHAQAKGSGAVRAGRGQAKGGLGQQDQQAGGGQELLAEEV